MKDRQIGETFNHPDYGRLKAVEEIDPPTCYGCVFNEPLCCANDPDKRHTGKCAADERLDKKGVIFMKVEEDGDGK